MLWLGTVHAMQKWNTVYELNTNRDPLNQPIIRIPRYRTEFVRGVCLFVCFQFVLSELLGISSY